MDNETITNAAYVVSSIWKQVNSMFSHIDEIVSDYSDKCKAWHKVKDKAPAQPTDPSSGLYKSCLYNYGIVIKPQTSVETLQIAFQAVVYDEREFETTDNWQPSLRVLIEAHGSGAWEPDSFDLFTAIDEEYHLNSKGNAWVLQEDQLSYCVFFIPLATIGSREYLETQVIIPALNIAMGMVTGAKVESIDIPEVACKFSVKDERIRFIQN